MYKKAQKLKVNARVQLRHPEQHKGILCSFGINVVIKMLNIASIFSFKALCSYGKDGIGTV